LRRYKKTVTKITHNCFHPFIKNFELCNETWIVAIKPDRVASFPRLQVELVEEVAQVAKMPIVSILLLSQIVAIFHLLADAAVFLLLQPEMASSGAEFAGASRSAEIQWKSFGKFSSGICDLMQLFAEWNLWPNATFCTFLWNSILHMNRVEFVTFCKKLRLFMK